MYDVNDAIINHESVGADCNVLPSRDCCWQSGCMVSSIDIVLIRSLAVT
jgi:hypothetical protein